MARLCPECEKKPFDATVAGRCLTPSANIADGHHPYTDSPSFNMCDACCEKFDRCARCNGPLSGGGGDVVPTEKQFVRVTQAEHVEGMNVGEQILVQKYVDLYSGLTWVVKKLSPGVKYYGRREVAIPGRPMIELELYFDLTEADPEAVIELVEQANSRWSTGGGTIMRVTAEVRR